MNTLPDYNNHVTSKCNIPCLALIAGTIALGLVLSIFRYPSADETSFLLEASVMADSFREGKWIGNEAVGHHGFLFKLPAALLVLVFGPSVFLATLTTVIMAGLCAWLCFKLFRHFFESDAWAFASVLVLVANFNFVQVLPTFLTDISGVFASLLLFYVLYQQKNDWIVGLVMLLLLDARESSFFAFAPALVLWFLLQGRMEGNQGTILLLANVARRCLATFTPAFAYLVLMFSTGLIPVNMWAANILGLTETGMQYQLKHFTASLHQSNVEKVGYDVLQIPLISGLPEWLVGYVNVFLAYISKLLYPRSFSFMATPKLVVIPAVVMSMIMFRKWLQEKRPELTVFCMIFWIYLALYLARVSHGRYFLPILPLAILFFTFFIRGESLPKKLAHQTLIWTGVVIVFGLFLVVNPMHLPAHITINAVVLLLMYVAIFTDWGQRWGKDLPRLLIFPAIAFFSLSTALAASYFTPGQLGQYAQYGYSGEAKRIVSEFEHEESVLINPFVNSSLIKFFRRDQIKTPEAKWQLRGWIPKKHLLHVRDDMRTHTFSSCEDMRELQQSIQELGIKRVGLVVSELSKAPFPAQECLAVFMETEWMQLKGLVNAKNKSLFLFSIVDSQSHDTKHAF
jgi:hypothetical protein